MAYFIGVSCSTFICMVIYNGKFQSQGFENRITRTIVKYFKYMVFFVMRVTGLIPMKL